MRLQHPNSSYCYFLVNPYYVVSMISQTEFENNNFRIFQDSFYFPLKKSGWPGTCICCLYYKRVKMLNIFYCQR